MTNIELELRDLGGTIAFPETPNLTAAVRARLEAPRRRRLPLRLDRRTVAFAFAALLVAWIGILSVPPARSAVLEWLGIKGVQLEFVEELPGLSVTENLDLGERTTLAEARRRAGFEVLEPEALGDADSMYFRVPPDGGQVAFLYGTPRRVRLLLTQFQGDYDPWVRKIVDGGASIQRVRVNGEPGVWIEGAHYFNYTDRSGYHVQEFVRLVNKVLLWERDGVTFRLEGDLTRKTALEIAESLD